MAKPPHFSDEFYRKHQAFVWRAIVQMGIPAVDGEDVSQTVFLTLLQNIERLKDESCLRAWIWGTCRRVVANHFSKTKKRREFFCGEKLDTIAALYSNGDASQSAINALSLRQLMNLLQRLPDNQREVFILYELEEFTMSEVAAAVGSPLQTAYSRLYQARRTLEGIGLVA